MLARNALITAVLGHPLPPGSSFVRWLLLEPAARERITNWADFASASVAGLRLQAGRRPHDRSLATLIDELRTDQDVSSWWNDHTVRNYAGVAKRIHHPTAGPLSFDVEILRAPHEPDQHLVVYTAQPDSPTARVLPLLASWESAHASATGPSPRP